MILEVNIPTIAPTGITSFWEQDTRFNSATRAFLDALNKAHISWDVAYIGPPYLTRSPLIRYARWWKEGVDGCWPRLSAEEENFMVEWFERAGCGRKATGGVIHIELPDDVVYVYGS